MSTIKYLSLNEIVEKYKIDKSYIMSLCKKNIIKYEDYRPTNIFISIEEIKKLYDYYKNVELSALKKYPIGVSDYIELRQKGYYYVDKTLLIRDIIQADDKVDLFTRPRRFGKTLTMSMLKAFFEKTNEDTSKYFRDTKIWQAGDTITSEQGKYPVIYLTFKTIDGNNWKDVYNTICLRISTEFARHANNMDLQKLNPFDKKLFEDIMFGQANDTIVKDSLAILSRVLCDYYGQKAILIIDEYDVPIQTAYARGYYNQSISFMREFLSAGLKDNQSVERGFISGILQVGKESIFSALNNIKVYSIFDKQKSEYFGFTNDEVREMLRYYHREKCFDEIYDWYDGYKFGDNEIINPWSLLNYLDYDCTAKEYWANTSSNDLIKDVVPLLGKDDFDRVCSLYNGKTIETTLDQNITYLSINDNPTNIYSYLLATGYLTIDKQHEKTFGVRIPNKEIINVFEKEILEKSQVVERNLINDLSKSIEQNNLSLLKSILIKYMKSSISYHDTKVEDFYQGFMTGMCIVEYGKYWVKSSLESGTGRFDICLEPLNKNKEGIIIELKKIKKIKSRDDLNKEVQIALNQIEKKEYYFDLREKGVKKINLIGMAFCGKEVEIEGKTLELKREEHVLERYPTMMQNQLRAKEDKQKSINYEGQEINFFREDSQLDFLLKIYRLIKNDEELLEGNKELKETIDFCDEKALIEYDFPKLELIRTINEIGMENIIKEQSKEWEFFVKDVEKYQEQKYEKKESSRDERDGPEM